MPYRINHIHLKSEDPEQTANWWAKAFNFSITSDSVRPAPFGDRFIRCMSEDGGMAVNISGPRTGESLGPGDASAHVGLEHFGFDSQNLEADIERLKGLGAELLEGRSRLNRAPASPSSKPRSTSASSSFSARERSRPPTTKTRGHE